MRTFANFYCEEPDHLCASQVGSDNWPAWFWSFGRFRTWDLSKRKATHCACSSACLRSALYQAEELQVRFHRAESPPAHPVARESLIKPSVNGCNNLARTPSCVGVAFCLVTATSVECDPVFDERWLLTRFPRVRAAHRFA